MENTPDTPESNPSSQPPPEKNGGKQGEFDYFFEKIRKINFQSFTKLVRPLGKFLPGGKAKEQVTTAAGSSLSPKDSKFSFLFKIPVKALIMWGVAIVLGYFIVQNMFLAPSAKEKEKKEAEKKQAAAQQKQELLPVKTFKVSRFNYEDSLNALGNIKGGVEFKLSFEIPGVINSINYREGERYEEGALLVSLKQDDILIRLKKAQAEKNKAETALSIAQGKYEEHQKLFKIGSIPKTTLEKVRLEVDSAQYEMEAADLEVKLNEALLEKSNLYAPSDGMIGELYVEEGEALTPNTLIGSHIATDVVSAEFGVVEKDVAKLALGQKARVYVDAYSDKTFEGVVENISPVVTGSSRTATVRVRLENSDGLLLPGMFARIKILLYSKRNALIVPTDAVQGKDDEASVFVVDARTNKVSKRNIKIGYTRPDYSQVDAGLEEGELVCVSGLEKLQDGLEVKVVEQQEASV